MNEEEQGYKPVDMTEILSMDQWRELTFSKETSGYIVVKAQGRMSIHPVGCIHCKMGIYDQFVKTVVWKVATGKQFYHTKDLESLQKQYPSAVKCKYVEGTSYRGHKVDTWIVDEAAIVQKPLDKGNTKEREKE